MLSRGRSRDWLWNRLSHHYFSHKQIKSVSESNDKVVSNFLNLFFTMCSGDQDWSTQSRAWELLSKVHPWSFIWATFMIYLVSIIYSKKPTSLNNIKVCVIILFKFTSYFLMELFFHLSFFKNFKIVFCGS